MKFHFDHRRLSVAASALVVISAGLFCKLRKTPGCGEEGSPISSESGLSVRERSPDMVASSPSSSSARIVGATEAIVPGWLVEHEIPITRLDEDPNRDGITNRQHMMAGTDPFGGISSRYSVDDADVSHHSEEIAAPSLAEWKGIVRRLQSHAKETDREHLENTRREAARRGIPVVKGEAALDGFAPDGTAMYLRPSNIALADTSGIDELWPAGAVTAVGGWPTGSSGFDLDGDGQTLSMWEVNGGGSGVPFAVRKPRDTDRFGIAHESPCHRCGGCDGGVGAQLQSWRIRSRKSFPGNCLQSPVEFV